MGAIIDSFRKLFSGHIASSGMEEFEGLELPGELTLKDGTRLDLSRKEDRKRFRKIVVDLQRQTDALAQRDLAEWRQAHQMALNVGNPSRQRLYDIYRDVELDLHLSGCIGQLQGFIMSKSFKLVDGKGDSDGDALKYLETAWFKQFIKYVLQARYWGHSLIELGDIVTREDGTQTFDGVGLIPRKHVIPDYGRITVSPGGFWEDGVDYRKPPYSDWLVEVGAPDDLGLYLKAAIQTIPKKYALAFWDSFAEMFGLPIRVAKTSSRDQKDIERLGKMMETMGSKAWAVLPEESSIELKESSRGDAYNVYDRRVDRANSELSKLVLLVTMTIEDGASLSQSKVHLQVLDNLIYEIADLVRDTVNDQLLPKMVNLGFPLRGLRFDWDEPNDYTPEQQKAFEEMILNNYEVDGSYFEDKYGLPVGERRQNLMPAPAELSRGCSGGDPAPVDKHAPHGFFD